MQPLVRKALSALLVGFSACIVWSSATIFTGGHPDLSPVSLMIRSVLTVLAAAADAASCQHRAAVSAARTELVMLLLICALLETVTACDCSLASLPLHLTTCLVLSTICIHAQLSHIPCGLACCRSAVGSEWGVQLLVMWPLAYICFCTYFALFR
jgi:hypothetical protein